MKRPDLSLARRLTRGVVLISAVPTVILAAIAAIHAVIDARQSAELQVQGSADVVATALEQYLDRHLASVEASALFLESDREIGNNELQRILQATHTAHPAFLTMLVADSAGRLIASSPSELLAKVSDGETVTDRPYFQQAISQRQTYLSEAFQGRGFGNDPIVAASHQVRRTDGSVYVLEGSFSLPDLGDTIATKFNDQNLTLTIVDSGGQVVYSNAQDQFPYLKKIALDRLAQDSVGSFGVAPTAHGWQVLVQHDAGWVSSRMIYAVCLITALLLLGLLTARWAGARLARSIGAPLSELADEMSQLSLEQSVPPRQRTETGIAELSLLGRAFDALIDRLRHTDKGLRYAFEEADRLRHDMADAAEQQQQQISERTNMLAEINDQLRLTAMHDLLTGLATRPVFQELLESFCKLGSRLRIRVGLIVVGIDGFDQLIQIHGRERVDQVVSAVSQSFRACMRRDGDAVARVGREDFALVMLGAEPDSCAAMARRIREAVTFAELDGEQVELTVTLAWTELTSERQVGSVALMAQLETVMNEVRDQGGNRIVQVTAAEQQSAVA